MRVGVAALVPLTFVLACGETLPREDGEKPGQPDTPECTFPMTPADAFCDGATAWLWDPPSKALLAFPDDYFTVADPSTKTGLKVDLRPDQNVTVPTSVAGFKSVYQDASRLDGFSVNGAIYLRFSGALNKAALPVGGIGSGKVDAPLLLVRLGDEEVTFLDFTLEAVTESAEDDSTTLFVKPLRPLEPGAAHALVATTALKDAANGCIAPSPAWLSTLDGTATDPGLARLGAQYASLVEKLEKACAIASAHDVSAAVLFTTQTIVDTSLAVRDDIAKKSVAYTQTGDCVVESAQTRCTGTLAVGDYRANKKYIDERAPKSTSASLPVSIWMPTTPGPYPVALVGHGLGGSRDDAAYFAQAFTDSGWALIAVDAPKHGEHYDRPMNANFGPLELFGVKISGMSLSLDTRQLTDNLRQATYDKLQVVRALQEGIDADGDGQVDLTAAELAYAGVSLGGIMAPELLALSDDFKLAVALVPGARLGDIIAESGAFAQGLNQLLGSATKVERKRLFAALQASVDRADAGSWGPYVLGNRLQGSDALKPQFLMQMVINDDVVPNGANAYYARALGLPLAGDELLDIFVPRIASLPARANLAQDLTGGVYQLDVNENGQTLNHATGPASAVAGTQIFHFIDTYAKTNVSEIIDSYRTLGAKP